MKPIGLTFKNVEQNPFTGRWSGELMIVHMCVQCSAISANRIAGDDTPFVVTELLEQSQHHSDELLTRLSNLGIRLLSQNDKQNVLTTLFGYYY